MMTRRSLFVAAGAVVAMSALVSRVIDRLGKEWFIVRVRENAIVLCCSVALVHATAAQAQDSARFPRLAPDVFAKLEDYVQLDLLRMKLDPSTLGNEGLFKYFVLLNNCSAKSDYVSSNINNEFEYPAIKKYYTENAPAILNALPMENVRTESPNNLLKLGSYSLERKEFPFVNGYGQDQSPLTLEIPAWGTSVVSRDVLCPNGPLVTMHGHFPGYVITREKLTFTAFPVDEQSARRFVDLSKQREFKLRITSQILPVVPRGFEGGGFVSYEFASTVTRIDVLTPDTNVAGEIIGTLYVKK